MIAASHLTMPDESTLRRLAADAPPIAGQAALAHYLMRSTRELAGIVARLTPDGFDASVMTPNEQRRLGLWAAARLAFEEQARQRDERMQRGREKRRRAAVLRAEDLLRGLEVAS